MLFIYIQSYLFIFVKSTVICERIVFSSNLFYRNQNLQTYSSTFAKIWPNVTFEIFEIFCFEIDIFVRSETFDIINI